MTTKPPLSEKGFVLFFAIGYPPNPAAASVVHKLLLDQFDPASFAVVTARMHFARKIDKPKEVKCHFIYHNFEFLSSRLHKFFARLQNLYLPILARRIIRKSKAAMVIATYPDLFFYKLAVEAALRSKVPFVPYLHDTIVEVHGNGKYSELSQKLQHITFNQSNTIAVMSDGMKALYESKYKVSTISWEHIYPESPTPYQPDKQIRVHWSGDIYEVNYRSVQRVQEVLKKEGIEFTISNGKSVEDLASYGVAGSNINKIFYPDRSDYLNHLSKSKILLLALNYPDETDIHQDELATIFSTKMPEYLGSGSLIVYHGPSDYFLARFIAEYNCGVVIDTRDQNILKEELAKVLHHQAEKEQKVIIDNASEAIKRFTPQQVCKKVRATL